MTPKATMCAATTWRRRGTSIARASRRRLLSFIAEVERERIGDAATFGKPPRLL